MYFLPCQKLIKLLAGRGSDLLGENIKKLDGRCLNIFISKTMNSILQLLLHSQFPGIFFSVNIPDTFRGM